MDLKLAILGFGVVGREFARLLLKKEGELRERYDLTWRITGLATRRSGIAVNPHGLDLPAVLAALEARQSLSPFHVMRPVADMNDFIHVGAADVLIETTLLDPVNGQPAIDHVRTALQARQNVITANKGPVVFAYRELTDLAAQRGRKFLFESTVMDGAPMFSLVRKTLPATKILGFRGILNSTTNFILTEMEKGTSLEDAVHAAQRMGIAEADPSNDVDGWDATVKTVALTNVLMDADLRPADVDRTGIRDVGHDKIRAALNKGTRIKLICQAGWEGERMQARVAPEPVSLDDPLAHVRGTSSALSLRTDTLKQVTVVEREPGPAQTAFGILADLVTIAQGE